jgi:hypothetical protein
MKWLFDQNLSPKRGDCLADLFPDAGVELTGVAAKLLSCRIASRSRQPRKPR